MRYRTRFLPVCLLISSFLSLAWSVQASEVHQNAADTRPLQPGSRVPSAEISAIDGGSVDLAQLTRESGALLVFYRGGW